MKRELIYRNPLSCQEDVADFILEGQAEISFENARMKLASVLDPALGQAANYVYWCPENFPPNIEIRWNFYPLTDEGLCMMFFAASGLRGIDMFDERLRKRDGKYDGYFDGDINAFHASYYRRKARNERAFRTCNLRKSKGFYLVAQGADPIPELADCMTPYRIKIVKYKNEVSFYINDLQIYRFEDDGQTYGDLIKGGRIGFRQMSPMVAEYSNLCVYALSPSADERRK